METGQTTGSEIEMQSGREVGVLIDDIAERLARSGNARALFGDPIERDGTTVIPVASVRFGFGGGGGRGKEREQQGQGLGAGGGGFMRPVGFIVMEPDKAPRFRRIRVSSPATRNVGLILGAWFLSRVLLRALGKIRA